ncbi:hypothetical protein QBZ16_002716 [Prototheca wickerhamii]|uniref:PPIase cyclophilin-type domain-containing protein n=1 Tax=Prototheca wickerhamii TaxID=3111 RepID=A0AAD9IID9_PROWI|nr:hypothetical protein QBZ16_002716 [Prototheca wickerhamii]
MSNVYNLEPPTQGKEAPKAVRNFVQLCLEGYYDGTPFHRVIKDFMVQGGDPTGTGTGGESIYGRPFKDEIHSRLRFTHRGLVACANRNEPHTNGSQFFITLDATPQLDRKYTIFGRVAGDTLYNLLRFNDVEVDADDRPEDAVTLRRADVLWNPFEDIAPRVDREAREAAAAEAAQRAAREAKEARRKGAKNLSLISFGDEAEADEEAAAAPIHIASAHDVLEDPRLKKEAAVEVDLGRVREAIRAAKRQHQEEMGVPHVALDGDAEYEASHPHISALEARMRERVLARKAKDEGAAKDAAGAEDAKGPADEERQGVADAPERREPDNEAPEKIGHSSESEDDGEARARPALEGTGRGQRSSAAALAPSRHMAVADAELLTDWQRRRKEYQERKRLGGHRQRDTLSKLQKFTQSLHSASARTHADDAGERAGEGPGPSGAAQGSGYSGRVREDLDHAAYMPAAWRVDEYLAPGGPEGGEDSSDDDLASLRAHKLTFAKETRDAMSRKESVDDYVVHDPLLEAGKAKFNKRTQAERKRGTQWAGRAHA